MNALKTVVRGLLWVTLISGSACDDAEDSNSDGGYDSKTTSCAGIAPSQPLSAACCMGHGVDACGAGLFCEAFDGRTQATCYAEHTRVDMSECSADIQCMSGSCNLNANACRSLPTQSCTSDIGCTSVTDTRYICAGDRCRQTMGELGDTCESQEDCVEGRACENNECMGREGDLCYESNFPVASCQADLCCNTLSPDGIPIVTPVFCGAC